MNRNGNETKSFAGNFVASGKGRLFFEVPLFLPYGPVCFVRPTSRPNHSRARPALRPSGE